MSEYNEPMKEFDLDYWVNKAKEKQQAAVPASQGARATRPTVIQPTANNEPDYTDTLSQIQEVANRLQATGTDITEGYNNWRDIGFALVEALGEQGREIYHQVSQFHPEYTREKTDEQYTKCLHSQGSGITKATFFDKAKQAGISVSFPKSSLGEIGEIGETEETAAPTATDPTGPKSSKSPKSPISSEGEIAEMDPFDNLPTFSEQVIHQLPNLLQRIVRQAGTTPEADILLLGSLTVFSACLYRIYGVYDRQTVYPNLFLFVTGNASSGKSIAKFCRYLAEEVADHLRIESKKEVARYKEHLKELEEQGQEPDPDEEKPAVFKFFIPANSSATTAYQRLAGNHGIGLMFETEGDTLANTLKNDYGNYSDGLRKAFHHERIAYARRKEDEDVSVTHTKLSTLLTGTPQQVLALMPNAENGLFSRFIFYGLNVEAKWKNVFEAKNDRPLDEIFQQFGKEFYDLYEKLLDNPEICFTFTPAQKRHFHLVFSDLQSRYAHMFGNDIIASIRRLGLITFRIAMILDALRIAEDGDISRQRTCSNTDYRTAITLVRTLIHHTAAVFDTLPAVTDKGSDKDERHRRQKFYNALPQTFTRKDFLEIAAKHLALPAATADKYIYRFIAAKKLFRTAHGNYEKP